MALPEDYLRYPRRRHGMDHDRYGWSDLFQRPPVTWPGGARIALWICTSVQWFPLDMSGKPFRAPGGLTMPYPDTRHYTSRDYGNRVGIYRILTLLERLRLPASFAVNAAVAERYPTLIQALAGREIIAHGIDASRVHYTGMQDEEVLVRHTLDVLRGESGQKVGGWLSPGRAQSFATPDILAANGVEYGCDWANDDMPYPMRTNAGELWAMPLAQETDDRTVLLDFRHTEDSWLEQTRDRFDALYRESARYGGRIMSVPLHAWVMGTPSRITYLREALDYMLGHEGVWPATGAEILDAFRASAPSPSGRGSG
ncbi:MAG TPA: polysaccharide deacetylase family protein [Acetobacteraceae bacterium]|nr:polysaccharide deacetylase family protein [Acetobacteraceae bacterium]